ncbi:MAG: GNAT family N-acetyltransferase [Rickettsiales bacterium]|jgi:ribosomal protein S18 acetylase RimI-like enzyme|nr:GNAT family N-acetyltransferase [Rickettsiales bacterium]
MSKFKVEVASAMSDEVYAAVCRLIPQLSRAGGSNSWNLATKEKMSAVVESSCARLLLARDDFGAICGILTLFVLPLTIGIHAMIEDLVVDESVRGRGVGRLLMQEAIRMAKESGAETVNLTSHPSRLAAAHLYKSLGFKQRETIVYKYDCRRTD